MQICGCSSAGRARPRHGRGHEFEARHPLHFGCAHALRCRAIWCWRPGCARPWPGHVQRDTASDGTLARGHSRSGFTTASVAQLAEQPPCKWQVARSIRRRRHQIDRSRSSSWPRTPGFQSGYAGSTPARDARTGTLVELALRGWKSAATIGRRRNPCPDGSRGGGCSSISAEQPPCKRQVAGSTPVTSANASLTQRPECRPV